MILRTAELIKLFRTEEVETTALDGINLSIEEGITIVMVTHSAEDAAVGKRIARILDGKISSLRS